MRLENIILFNIDGFKSDDSDNITDYVRNNNGNFKANSFLYKILVNDNSELIIQNNNELYI